MGSVMDLCVSIWRRKEEASGHSRANMARTRIDFTDMSLQSLVLCGVSVQTTAIFSAYYRPIQMDEIAVVNSATDPWSLLFSIALALLLIAMGVTSRTMGHLVQRPIPIAVAALVFTVATFASSFLAPDSLLCLGSDLVARVSSAFLMLGWLRVFANFDSDTVLQTLPAVMAFGLVLIVISISAGPSMRLVSVVVLSALAAVWLAWAAHVTVVPAGKYGPDDEALVAVQPTDKDAENAPKSSPLHSEMLVCGAAFLLSLLLGVLCVVPYHSEGDDAADPFFLYFLLMMGLALLLLAFLSLFDKRNPLGRSVIVARLVVPLVVVAICVVVGVIVQPPFNPLINAVGRMCMELTLIICFLLASRHFSLLPIRTAAFGQAAFLLGNSLGVLLGLSIPAAVGIPRDHLLIMSVVILLLTTEALFMLLMLYRFSRTLALRAAAAAAAEEPASDVSADSTDAFAETFHLSEKESEVLRLTVRGRSRQRIAESLYVSIGTVNTYFYRIYQKTGVHTRQELLDKIEEFQDTLVS